MNALRTTLPAPVVIAAIRHGLGNQMFQYAMGRALAEQLGVPLKLDLTGRRGHPTRPFALDGLQAVLNEASAEEIAALRPNPSRLRRKLEGFGLVRSQPNSHCFKESRFYHFDPRVLELQAPVYVEGFWQSVRYFEALRPQLVRELTPRPSLAGASAELRDEIAAAESVCVHVRRGDYVTDEVVRVLPEQYYEQATAAILARVPAPQFVVFSDDPEWTRQHLSLPGPVIWSFERNRHSALEDLQLMLACKHFIIANSSFSFWPAWLCEHATKQVVRPARWFRNPDWQAPELSEPSWIVVDA